MGPLLKLFCRGSHEHGARGPKPSHEVSATASEETIYTHLTTLFEDNEGLYSFVTKLRHDGPYPQDSVRDYLVPAANVVSYKRVELMHRSLPPKYRTSLIQRIHLYDDRKPLFAHLTTVFWEERALFSFYLEFQGRSKGNPREIEDRHPRPDQIVYAKQMDPVVTRLAGHCVLSRASSVQYSSRSQRMTANDRRSDNNPSGALRERVPTAHPSEPARRWYSEAARPTQRPLLDRSMSAAAARTALYGSDRSQRARRSSRNDQRPVESDSYLKGTARARESYHSAETTQYTGNPNRDLVFASTESHLDQETQPRGSLDRRNRITRLERQSSTNLRREYIQRQAPERTSTHVIRTTNQRSRSRSKTRGPQRSSQMQEQPRSANTDTLGGRPAVIDDPPSYIMSPKTELLHNPFAESPPRHIHPRTPPAPADRTERRHVPMQHHTLRRRSSPSSTDSYERPRPRTALPQSPIRERNSRAEPRDRGSHRVHFDLSNHSTEDLNRAYNDTRSTPTYRMPHGERRTYVPLARRESTTGRQTAPVPPATFSTCKRRKTMPPGIDMKGYCSNCWVHLDPAEKLLCGECYRTFTATHEDSREILTMCETCYEAVPGVLRERERMRALGIGYDEGF